MLWENPSILLQGRDVSLMYTPHHLLLIHLIIDIILNFIILSLEKYAMGQLFIFRLLLNTWPTTGRDHCDMMQFYSCTLGSIFHFHMYHLSTDQVFCFHKNTTLKQKTADLYKCITCYGIPQSNLSWSFIK